MPDIGHLPVAVLAGAGRSRRELALLCALAYLPDLDLLGRFSGFPDGSAWGHRGAAHSLAAAALAGAAVLAVTRRRGWAALCAAVMASHGALDMFDRGTLGVMYLWPASKTPYFWPVRFLPGPPPGEHWLTSAGVRVVAVEMLWLLPLFALAAWKWRRNPDVA